MFSEIFINISDSDKTIYNDIYVDHKNLRVFKLNTNECIGVSQRINNLWRIII